MPREEVRVGGEKNGRKRGRLGLRMGVCEWGSGSKEVKKKKKGRLCCDLCGFDMM